MELMTVDEYIDHFYSAKSRPNRRTIIRLIKCGNIAGIKQGKCYYVDIDAEQHLIG